VKLSIILPERMLLERDVRRIVAEAPNGSFCLLERHIDFVSSLVPGILAFTPLAREEEEGEEEYAAVDGGLLVKRGRMVWVSTRRAILGELEELERAVEEDYMRVDERERKARSALSRMEADFARRFLDMKQRR
jgi:F-type H+-transporting ATPase subunit epsilon